MKNLKDRPFALVGVHVGGSNAKQLKEVMEKESKAKPDVMAKHRKLLEERYNLEPKFDENVKMSRGKPVPVGPTAKLKNGLTWLPYAPMNNTYAFAIAEKKGEELVITKLSQLKDLPKEDEDRLHEAVKDFRKNGTY